MNELETISFSLPSKTLAAAAPIGGIGTLLPGEDDVVYTMACRDEEDIVSSVLVEDQSLVCRPVSIISFNSDCGSEAALALEPQPISISSDAALDGSYHLNSGIAANTDIKDVVAMAEVGGTVWLSILASAEADLQCFAKSLNF